MGYPSKGKEMSDEYKVFRDLSPSVDAKLKKWMKNPQRCFICKSKDVIRFRGKIKCPDCGMIVIDYDYNEQEPTGVM